MHGWMDVVWACVRACGVVCGCVCCEIVIFIVIVGKFEAVILPSLNTVPSC